MYDVFDDPYCYKGTRVLKNLPGLREADALAEYETAAVTLRGEEALPEGDLDARHYRAIHRHLFQDVYRWAGQLRTVRMSRGESSFCYPEHIARSLDDLFARLARDHHLAGLEAEAFARGAAGVLAELNHIHAFRDGNGRAQAAFLAVLGARAGHALDLARLDEAAFLDAMVRSFYGDEAPLGAQILALQPG